jgi:hypothetical protein
MNLVVGRFGLDIAIFVGIVVVVITTTRRSTLQLAT